MTEKLPARREAVLDSRFHIRHRPVEEVPENQLFSADPANKAHLVNQLILSERMVIPTLDFGIVSVLLDWIDFGLLVEALQEKNFKFVKLDTMLAYYGNGDGISMITASKKNPENNSSVVTAAFGDVCSALEAQITSQHRIPLVERGRLTEAVLSNTISYRSLDTTTPNIEEETHRDILALTDLKQFVLRDTGAKEESLDLKKLPGIKPNEMRVAGAKRIENAFDLVLRVAEINMELLISRQVEASDLSTSRGAERILAGKLQRIGVHSGSIEGLIRLIELNKIPDVGKGVAAGAISFEKFWKLRNSAEAKKFREWFRNIDTTDPREVEREFVAVLSRQGLYASLPMKILRLAVCTVLDLFVHGSGTTVGALDSLIVEDKMKAYTPRVFLEELRKLPG